MPFWLQRFSKRINEMGDEAPLQDSKRTGQKDKFRVLFSATFITFCICLPENEAYEISESSFMASDLNVLDYKFLKDYEKESVEGEIFGSNWTEAASDELQPAGESISND
ncbi:hypothetical protein TNCV_2216231 [Trichonephila clavipes]|nr:hypothetical protein TNCV_2216231 [Trichonephila clavipes]